MHFNVLLLTIFLFFLPVANADNLHIRDCNACSDFQAKKTAESNMTEASIVLTLDYYNEKVMVFDVKKRFFDDKSWQWHANPIDVESELGDIFESVIDLTKETNEQEFHYDEFEGARANTTIYHILADSSYQSQIYKQLLKSNKSFNKLRLAWQRALSLFVKNFQFGNKNALNLTFEHANSQPNARLFLNDGATLFLKFNYALETVTFVSATDSIGGRLPIKDNGESPFNTLYEVNDVKQFKALSTFLYIRFSIPYPQSYDVPECGTIMVREPKDGNVNMSTYEGVCY